MHNRLIQAAAGLNGSDIIPSVCTFDPIYKDANVILSNGNKTATWEFNSSYASVLCTVAFEVDKYYWEILLNEVNGNAGSGTIYGGACGSRNTTLNSYLGSTEESWGCDNYVNNSLTYRHPGEAGMMSIFHNWSNGDVLLCAYDGVACRFYMGYNGTWYNSGNPDVGTGFIPWSTAIDKTVYPAVCANMTTGSNIQMTCRFDASEWTYDPSSINASNFGQLS